MGYYLPSFWAIISPFLITQKIKIKKKMKKNAWKYHHFTHVYQKLWSHDVRFLRHGVQRTDGQMDGQKKWHLKNLYPFKEGVWLFWNKVFACYRTSLFLFEWVIFFFFLNFFLLINGLLWYLLKREFIYFEVLACYRTVHN